MWCKPMSERAIRAEGIGKRFRIGQQTSAGIALFGRVLLRGSPRPFGDPMADQKTSQRATGEMFWALKDVSFDSDFGDTLGVIGRNGAGKSTLLEDSLQNHRTN